MSLHNEDLILENLDLVNMTVNHFMNSYPGFYDYNELMSHGYWGLIDASQKFDKSKKTQFKNYAPQRIKGSIIDGLRSNGLYCRSKYFKAQVPLFHILQNKNYHCDDGSEIDEDDCIDQNWQQQYNEINNKLSWLGKALASLSLREQDMIDMYYNQGYYYKEIGQKYGVNESRAYQIINKALEKIRNNFGDKIKEERMII